jgi:Ca-activated chloride channel homolog
MMIYMESIAINGRSLLRQTKRSRNRQGAMAVFISICLVTFLVIAAFAINVAHIHLSKAELRTAVDGASRAAARELANDSATSVVVSKAIDIASRNRVANQPLSLLRSNVVLGQSVSTGGKFVFTAGASPFNSVRVVGDRSSRNRINSVFGQLIGMPTYGAREVSTAVRADRDIMVVIDRSGSMMRRLDDLTLFPPGCDATTPPHPTDSRWAKMMDGYGLFLNVLDTTSSTEHIGLVTYGSDSSQDLDLSPNYQPSYDSLVDRSTRSIEGMTNLGDGLKDGLQKLFYGSGVRPYSAKTIVLLTDGRPNVGPDPLEQARACKAASVLVHTITFGNFCDNTLMTEIANITGGTFYAAPDDAMLRNAFTQIAKNVPILIIE